VLLRDADDDVAAAEVVEVVGERAQRVEHVERVPSPLELEALPLHRVAVKEVGDGDGEAHDASPTIDPARGSCRRRGALTVRRDIVARFTRPPTARRAALAFPMPEEASAAFHSDATQGHASLSSSRKSPPAPLRRSVLTWSAVAIASSLYSLPRVL